MTTISELTVEIEGKEVGLSALLQKVDAQTQKAADSALRLQQQYARLAAAQGNTAGATSILSNALTTNGGASERALVGTATQLTKLNSTMSAGENFANQFGGALKSQLLGLVGPAAIATAAIGAISGTISLAQTGAQLQAAERSFQSLSASAGQSSQALLTAMRQAAAGTIADAQLMQSANTGLLLSNGRIAKELPKLIEIARASAQATGQDIGFIFDSLTRGIARGSPQIIDNAGITLDASAAFETYAKSIGKSADELTKAEQQQATLNAVVAAGNDIIQKSGVAADGNAVLFARFGTQLTNTKNALSEFAAGGVAAVIKPLFDFEDGLSRVSVAAADMNTQLAAGYGVTQQMIDAHNQLAASEAQVAAASQSTTDIEQNRIAAMNAAAQQAAAVTQAETAQANSLEMAGIQARAAAEAATLKSNADQVAAVDAQTHSIANQQLALQAQAAAQALLASGGQGAATAAVLAQSSSQIDVLTAAYYRLAAAQRVANAGATQQQAADFRSMEVFGQTSAQRNAQIAKDRAADTARSQQIIQTGTATQKVAELQRLYNDAVRQSGPASAQAIQAETALRSARQASARAGGRGGGGGAKLSEQQKLNNSLLADQDKFNDQYEDADLKHAQNLLKIQTDYAEKMRQAQQQFDQDALEGRAGFYDNLGSIENDKIRAAASAQYEAAAQQAQQIAAQKGADVADKYMQAQEQVISARAKRLAEIEKAAKDKDDGKAEYLKGVDEAYRRAEDAKLARIQEGEGSLAAERDKQTQDENQKYEESQGKIAESAERAADRKIAAADRAGKKIDEEQAKAAALAATYDKIAAAGAPTTGGPPVAPGSTPTAAAGSAPGNPVVDAINGARDALTAALAAIERATRETTGAVKAIGNRGGVAG